MKIEKFAIFIESRLYKSGISNSLLCVYNNADKGHANSLIELAKCVYK